MLDTNEFSKAKIDFNTDGEELYITPYDSSSPDSIGEIFFHLPVPFKQGDILEAFDSVFVLDDLPHWDSGRGKKYEDHFSNMFNDRTDMIGWGFYVGDDGVLYGDHTGMLDYFKYYRGKLEGKERLLHYVSMYMQGNNDEIRLPELLTMQSRIMLEHLMDNGLLIHSHGCYIQEHHMAENRLTEEEKEQVRRGVALAPWLVGKLTLEQVKFLSEETGADMESIQLGLCNDGGWHMGRCAKMVHMENYYEKNSDSRFDPGKRAMAISILDAFGKTETDWLDNYQDPDYEDNGFPPMPDWARRAGGRLDRTKFHH